MAVWIYAIYLATMGRITIGDLALVIQVIEQERNALEQAFFVGGLFYEHSLYVANLLHFLDLKPTGIVGALASPADSSNRLLLAPSSAGQEIEFRHVSFRYPGIETNVITNLSFTIHPGETVALVGENGAGKTTLVKLLARLYDPCEGAIRLDGHDLREYDLESLRSQIGVIFQDYLCYQLTARENIGFGKLEYLDDTERVLRAAELGGARSVVDGLPQGLDTMLGRTFDSGVDLSGGEWQKMALSRAFMRDTQLLILDEPTASLDAYAEHELYQKFTELATGRTTLLISHRFSTVRMANHILVLRDGRLVEEGSHNELIALKGRYAEMYNLQAESYQPEGAESQGAKEV
jgi:ATP-binding cassette, subfamily B, bacterial